MTVTAHRHLFLAGFMGTGKTAVGRLLAARLALHFADLDEVVEAVRRRPIAEIFRVEGEEAFRHLEARSLRLLITSPGMVIALGGGAPMIPSVAATVRQTGRTILLTADWETIWRRVRDDGAVRPLLAPVFSADGAVDDTGRLAAFVRCAEPIMQSRRDAYHSLADLVIDTTHLSVDEAVGRIIGWRSALS